MRIVITRADGGISIMVPASGFTTIDEEIAKWAELHVGEYVSHEVVDDAAIPTDRYFRNAWKGDLTVDMDKAREIQRSHIRAARIPLLAALDVEYMRAHETGDSVKLAEVTAQKQALRDAPADLALDAAKTPEELKAIWPTALGQR